MSEQINMPGKIGYLVPEFPGQTHAFFWREMIAIEQSGAEVVSFSTRKPNPESCPHAFGSKATERTQYLFPPNFGRSLLYLATRPIKLACALTYVFGLRQTSPLNRSKLMALILSSADMAVRCDKADIQHIHIHSCANAAHLGAITKILNDTTYSLTLHGDMPVYGTDHAAKMGAASFVSAVTRPLAQTIQDLLPDQRNPVIWMGVDLERFKPVEKREKVSDSPSQLKIVTVARLNNTKGHRYFLRAMAKLKSENLYIQYQIAGDGPLQVKIQQEIESLGLSDQVELLGSLDETAVLHLLQSADALALTSIGKGEAAPVTVMEAMACGLPVICSIIGGTTDMIEHESDGLLVAQKDVDGIADAIRVLAIDPAVRAEIGKSARQTAVKKFDYRINARLLYDQIKLSITGN